VRTAQNVKGLAYSGEWERYRDRTYSVRNAKVFKRDPHPLNKWTEATAEKRNIRIPRMCVGSIEGFACTVEMILFSRIRGNRHDRRSR